ncbi:MAG: endonuclease [Bacteroidetes bacterium GWF2_38_335]|nr:MAG: endonuclease [Bacteroidetes bacterium GWF2_38_335]OFY77689.1 MAG: endonuclease [Bacteroidetes bacterium RIFOXYA12_FULL_38_20]HBS89080.1 endonuclease [Bacteroidales bacterium]
MNRYFWMILATLVIVAFQVKSQNEKKVTVGCIGFYNVENLYDTVNQENNDEEFLPEGKNKWTGKRYKEKLNRMSDVISQLGTEITPDGIAILGMSEIENKSVLEDLVKTEKLKGRKYQIVHYDSPDVRGVDVALIYQPKYFKVLSSKSYRLKVADKPDFKTRDQLLVSGIFDGDTLHVIVNHWPSRRGGEKRSRPLRNAAADLTRSISDSIMKINKNAKIIIMGDLNDDPINESVKLHLKAVKSKEEMTDGTLFNPMESLFKQGVGSLAYRDNWNLFDQLVLSPGLVNKSDKGYSFHKAVVFNKKFLMQSSGQYAGYPLRTYVGSTYQGGYSDHFPVYIFIAKEL